MGRPLNIYPDTPDVKEEIVIIVDQLFSRADDLFESSDEPTRDRIRAVEAKYPLACRFIDIVDVVSFTDDYKRYRKNGQTGPLAGTLRDTFDRFMTSYMKEFAEDNSTKFVSTSRGFMIYRIRPEKVVEGTNLPKEE